MKDEKQTIEEMAKDVSRSISWCDDVIPAVDCIGTAAALYGQGYRKQSGWISVDERLPEFDERVLVCLDSKRSYTKIDTDRIVRGRGVRWGNDITHWQPLPEAPKMKGGEE